MPIEAEVTILLAIIAMIIACYLILSNQIKKESNTNVAQAEQIKSLSTNLSGIKDALKELSDKRMDDNLKFTEALAKLNNTLVKFDVTMKNLDKTLDKGIGELASRLQAAEKTLIDLTVDVKQIKAQKLV